MLHGVKRDSGSLATLDPADEADLVRQGEVIRARCAEFGVEGSIEAISPGPVITVFEFQPAPQGQPR